MKALSIAPYYAMAICDGLKTIECRTWKTDYRGTIVICSTAQKDHRCIPSHALCLADIVDIVPFTKKHLKKAYLEDIGMPDKPSYAWILNNIRLIVPVPVKGKLSLWNYEGEIKLIDDLKFKDKKEEEEFWTWYESLEYLSPKWLKYEKEHAED